MRIAVDTSAIVAILRTESHAPRIRTALERADDALISTANILELQLVLSGRREAIVWQQAKVLFEEYAIAPCAFDARQLELAREAVLRFGKGRHKAGLNFGDCFAYALAKSEDIPLLFTGNDFSHTDVAAA